MVLAVVWATFLMVHPVRAATQYATGTFLWDDGTTAIWSAIPGGPYNAVWTSRNDAIFEGVAGTVSIAAAGATAHNVTFNTTGYMIQGNTLTLNGTTPTLTVGSGISATISSVIAGNAGLTKAGSGTLTLGAAETYSGPTAITGGVLQLQGGQVKLNGQKIMPIGDSITFGLGGNSNSYRGPLFASLTAAGDTFTTVGTRSDGAGNYTGNIGWYVDNIATGVTPTTQTAFGTDMEYTSPKFYQGIQPGFGWLGTYKPDIITLHIGSNDAGQLPWSYSIQQMTNILDTVHMNSPNTTVYVAQIVPQTNPDERAAYDIPYNAALATLVSAKQAAGYNLALVDMYTNFPANGLSGDGIHPNNTGYSFMASQFYNAIRANTLASNLLPVTTPLAIAANSTFDLAGFNQQVASLGDYVPNSSTGTMQNSNTSRPATLTLSPSGGTTTFSGVIAGGGGLGAVNLNVNGTGVQVLSGANTYVGSTFISGGTLRLGAANALPVATQLLLGNVSGAVFDLNGYNQTVALINGGGTTGGNITLGSGTLTIGNGGGFINTVYGLEPVFGGGYFYGNISGGGGLVMAASGAQALGGASAYSGATTVSSGTLLVAANAPSGSNGALGNASSDVALGTAGGNNSAGILTAGPVTVGRNIRLATTGASDAGTRTLTIGGNTFDNSTFSGNIILGTDGQSGYGVTLSAISGQAASAGGPGYVASSGTVNFTGVIQDPSGGTSTAYTVTKAGGGTVVLAGANTYAGATAINAGTLQIGGSGCLGNGNYNGSISISNGAAFNYSSSASQTLSGAISGRGNVVQAGPGTLVLSANNNNFGGGLLLNAGTLTAGNAAAFGTGTLMINGGALDSRMAGLVLNAVPVTINADFAFTGTNSLNLGTRACSLGTAAGTARTITVNANTLTLAGIIGNGTTANSLIKAGGGTLILSGVNAFTGGTTVNNGILQLSGAGTLGSVSSTLTVNGGVLDLNSTNPSIGNLTGTGGTVVNNHGTGTVTLTLGTGSTGGGNFQGVIADNSGSGTGKVALTKIGGGTITLSGANTYTGGTNVNAGTLLWSGSNNLPAAGTLVAAAGGTFSLADGIARSTSAAALSLAANSTLTFDWSGSATDTLVSSAAATTQPGVVNIKINPATPGGGTLTLISSPNGGLATAAYCLVNNTNFTAGLGQNDTAVTISNYATATALTSAYWLGGRVPGALGSLVYSNGTNSNWASAATGTSAGGVVPGGTTVPVIFGATGSAQQANITVDADMTLASLTFNDSAAVTIGGTHFLNLNSTAATAASTTAALATVTPGSAISVTSFANATNTLNANVVLGASQTWNVAGGKTLNVNGVVSGSNNLTIGTSGNTGSVVLAGSNTYSGTTTVNYGILKAGVSSVPNISGAFGINSAVTLANAAGVAIDLNGYNTQIGSLAGGGGTGGNVSLGTATLTVGGGNANTTYAGVISSSAGVTGVSLNKIGTGQLQLDRANTYTGRTVIDGGKLYATEANGTLADAKLGAIPATFQADNITIKNGGTLNLASGTDGRSLGANRGIYLDWTIGGNPGYNYINTGTGDFTVNGTISGPGGLAHVNLSGGYQRLYFGSDNTYSGDSYFDGTGSTSNYGGIDANGHALAFQNSALDANSVVSTFGVATTTSGSVVTLQIGGLVNGNRTLQDLTGNPTFNNLILNTYVAGVTKTFTNVIGTGNHTGTSLTKTGAGTQVLGGSNTYTGLTTVSGGKLTISPTGTINSTSGVLIGAGEFNYNSATVLSRSVSFSGTGGILSGTGTMGVSTTIAGIHAPGDNGVGIQTFSNGLIYAATSHLQWQLNANTVNGRGTAFDGVDVTGGSFVITSGATLDLSFIGGVDFSNSFWNTAHNWTVADLGSGLTGDGGSSLFALAAYSGPNYTTAQGSFTVSRVADGSAKNDVVLTWQSPYDLWATAQGLTASNNALTANPDGDSNNNLTEYAFNTNPNNAASGPIKYVAGSPGSITSYGTPILVVTQSPLAASAVFGRRVDRVEAGLTYTVQFSADLGEWVDSATTPTVVASDPVIQAVSVPFPATISTLGGTKVPLFFKVKVEKN